MKEQNYQNHVRYYPPHHFVFYPVILVAIICSARGIFIYPDRSGEWIAITGAFVLIAWAAFMMRQHYALNNQNRIVRLEMRFRYYVLTQKRFEPIEQQLSFGQLSALRFASDEELPGLIRQTLDQQLKPNDIKKAIKNWLPDHMRV